MILVAGVAADAQIEGDLNSVGWTRRRSQQDPTRLSRRTAAWTAVTCGFVGIVAAAGTTQPPPLSMARSLSVSVRGDYNAAGPAPDSILALVGQSGGWVSSVGADAGVVFLGVGPRVAVLDASDVGASPQLLAMSGILTDTVRDLLPVLEDQVAVAAGAAGLCMFDVVTPRSPTLSGCTDVGGVAVEVTAREHVVFVGAGTQLQAVHLGEAGDMVRLGSFDLGTSATEITGLAIHGNRLMVALGSMGLAVVDVTEPHRPQLLQWMEFDCRAVVGLRTGVAAIELVRKTEPGGGISIEKHLVLFDDATSSKMQEVGRLDLGQWGGESLIAHGDVLYVTKEGRLEAIDVADPTTPEEGGSCPYLYDPLSDVAPGATHWAAVIGDRMFRAVNASDEHGSGVEGVDISRALYPIQASSWLVNVPGNVTSLAVIGSHVVVGESGNGIGIMDVSEPASPIQVSAVHGDGSDAMSVTDLAVVADQLYVLSTSSMVYRIDASDPVVPRVTSSGRVDRAASLAAANPYLVVGTEQSYPRTPVVLEVLDLQVDGQIKKIGEVAVGDECSAVVDVAIDAGLAYLACGGKIAKIVALTDPPNPRLVSTIPLPGYARAITARRGYAYVLTRFPASPENERVGLIESGVVVLLVGNGEDPRVLSQWSGLTDESRCRRCQGESGWSITAWGEHLFLPTRAGGVRVINVEEPTTPQQVEEAAISGFAFAAAAHGGYLYVAAQTGGLYVFRIINGAQKATPTSTVSPETPAPSTGTPEGPPRTVTPPEVTVSPRGSPSAAATNVSTGTSTPARPTAILGQHRLFLPETLSSRIARFRN